VPPYGGIDENGPIPERFAGYYETMLTREDNVDIWTKRTSANLEGSDATLIFISAWPLPGNDGTQFTMNSVIALGKPYWISDLSKSVYIDAIVAWVAENPAITVLNIAGPRESSSPGIYEAVYTVTNDLYQLLMYKGLIRCK